MIRLRWTTASLLIILAIVVLISVFAPIHTALRLYMPPGPGADSAARETFRNVVLGGLALELIIILGLVLLAIWMVRRWIKRMNERAKPDPADVF